MQLIDCLINSSASSPTVGAAGLALAAGAALLLTGDSSTLRSIL